MQIHLHALRRLIIIALAFSPSLVAQPEPSGSINQHLSFALDAAQRQDTAQIAALAALLTHPQERVRRYAAFALGQIGSVSGSVPLLAALRQEKSDNAGSAMLEALGRCGDRHILTQLMQGDGIHGHHRGNALAFSIARFAMRGIKDSGAVPLLASLLLQKETRAAASYALVRSVPPGTIRQHAQMFRGLLSDSSSDVRMWGASLLGMAGDSGSRDALIRTALHDVDWRVRVNATRALRSHQSGPTTRAINALLHDSCEHVSLTAFSVLRAWNKLDPVLLDQCEKIFGDTATNSWRQRGEAAFILAGKSERSIEPVCAALKKVPPAFTVRLLRALGERSTPESRAAITDMLTVGGPGVRAEAIAAYRKILTGGTVKERDDFCQRLLPLSAGNDPAVIVAIAETLQDTLLPSDSRRAACIQFIPLLKELNGADLAEAKAELANAFKLFTDSAELREVLRLSSPPVKTARRALTEEESQLLQRFQSALVITTRGTIHIQFRADAAPFTVVNFIRLAQRSFYDGTVFHRVVPNFVIQGGDPLGTGFGGPGYAINTEVHPDAAFTSGTVGMASAGRNTEGSQFFITHCATPHLNGNYTVFGETKDRTVVDAVQEGDSILGVRLLQQ